MGRRRRRHRRLAGAVNIQQSTFTDQKAQGAEQIPECRRSASKSAYHSTYLPHVSEQVNRSRAARARCRDASLPAKAGPRTALSRCALRAATQRDLLRPSPAGSALRGFGPRALLRGEGGWKLEGRSRAASEPANQRTFTRARTRTYICIQVLRRRTVNAHRAQVQLSTPGPYRRIRTPLIRTASPRRTEKGVVPSSALDVLVQLDVRCFEASEHKHVRTLLQMHAALIFNIQSPEVALRMRATRLTACKYKRCQSVRLGRRPTTNVPTRQIASSWCAHLPPAPRPRPRAHANADWTRITRTSQRQTADARRTSPVARRLVRVRHGRTKRPQGAAPDNERRLESEWLGMYSVLPVYPRSPGDRPMFRRRA